MRLRQLSITDSKGVNWSKLWEMVKDREAWHVAVHGVTKNQIRFSNWTTRWCSGFRFRSFSYDHNENNSLEKIIKWEKGYHGNHPNSQVSVFKTNVESRLYVALEYFSALFGTIIWVEVTQLLLGSSPLYTSLRGFVWVLLPSLNKNLPYWTGLPWSYLQRVNAPH